GGAKGERAFAQPVGHGPQRFFTRGDDGAQHHQAESEPASQERHVPMEKNHEQAEAEQPKNNTGLAVEVKDGDANQANETRVLAVLFEVNRAANSDRQLENNRTDDKQRG